MPLVCIMRVCVSVINIRIANNAVIENRPRVINFCSNLLRPVASLSRSGSTNSQLGYIRGLLILSEYQLTPDRQQQTQLSR